MKDYFTGIECVRQFGRVIGYRGSKSTDVLINLNIWWSIKELIELKSNFRKFLDADKNGEDAHELFKSVNINSLISNVIRDGINVMPYSVNDKFEFLFDGYDKIKNKIFDLQKLESDKMIKRRSHNGQVKFEKVKDQLEKLFFTTGDKSFMIYSDVSEILIKNNVRSVNGNGIITPKKVANYFEKFGVKAGNKTINNKSFKVVIGIAKK